MQHPFQSIVSSARTDSSFKRSGYLIAVCGSRIISASLQHGIVKGQWAAEDTQITDPNEKDDVQGGERPAKKQKTGHAAPKATKATNILKLATSPDQQYVVAATDDKFIRVLDIDSNGQLTELSQRCMPKRPCAIEIMPDNTTILCGDKFGDVYSLPLLPTEADEEEGPAPEPTIPTPGLDFKPAANNLTIHTKRNRKALESQMKQKNFTPRKEALKFQHQLLLGHVSMLTDMKLATRIVNGQQRTYIVTADRDEHVRISRGPAQAHIIEGYCLGHTEFISKICLVPGTDLLVSGGGDNWLGVWSWPTSRLLRKINLLDLLRMNTDAASQQDGFQPTIAGLSTMEIATSTGTEQAIVVFLEKVKAVWLITHSVLASDVSPDITGPTVSAHGVTCIKLPSYPLDVVPFAETLIVSLDARTVGDDRLVAYKVQKKGDEFPEGYISAEPLTAEDGYLCNALREMNATSGPQADEKQLDGLLYAIADLRKRRDQIADEAENGDPTEPVVDGEVETQDGVET